MSDSDDSDDSELPFDVEIEKCEKRLQLARYKKKAAAVPVFTSEGRAVGVGSDENAAPCLRTLRYSKTRPIAHAVAAFA